MPLEDDIDGRILVVVIILGFPFVRFVSYVFGHLPPAGIRARIRTRRLIIPGYDQVLLVPLIGAVAGVALLLAANYLWGLPSWSAGLIIGAALFYNLTARPSFAEWHLTGHHRLATWASTAPRHSFDASFDNPGDYQPHRSPEAVSS
jgi:hypothetical protein